MAGQGKGKAGVVKTLTIRIIVRTFGDHGGIQHLLFSGIEILSGVGGTKTSTQVRSANSGVFISKVEHIHHVEITSRSWIDLIKIPVP